MPPLFIKISILPKAFIAFFVSSSKVLYSRKSNGMITDDASLFRNDCCTLSKAVTFREDKISWAPCSLNNFAIASPNPEEAPVIQTILFLKFMFLRN